MQQQVLCNNKEAIRFDIHITQNLINFLINDGYLEEEDFNFEEYLKNCLKKFYCFTGSSIFTRLTFYIFLI